MDNSVIDLFSGCGGFSVGFEAAGFKITKAVEFDKQIAQTYAANHRGTLLYVDDNGNVDNEHYFKEGEAPIIVGGPPCQGFSMAGARIRGNSFLDDPRNYLFKHYVNVVKIVRPKVFVLENVKGILTMKGGEIFNEIVRTFSSPETFSGDRYYLHYRVVKAVEYGIPQRRERVVVIGCLNQDFDINELFEQTRLEIIHQDPHFFDSVSVWDAIGDLGTPNEKGTVVTDSKRMSPYALYLNKGEKTTDNHVATHHSQLAERRMKQVHGGENWTVLKDNIKSVHSGAYGRLLPDAPSTTITTRFDTPSGGRFTHPVEDRTITPREAARIQSFPDKFTFYGSRTSICKQIGNAVPPKMAFFLATLVKHLI